MQIEKVYEPRQFEPRWAEWWISSGLFHANPKAPGRVFSLVIPPPNVTGSLHMGHMLEYTEIDAIIRWRRMSGDNTLWLPGADHAGIATQMVVERELARQGLNRRELGREKFEERVWEWKRQYGGRIQQQMQRVGVSCDWSRERFTLDPGPSRAVREVFVRLHRKGLVYRGEYMVNWCPRCHTALSDLEVDHEETPGNLWHLRYPVQGTDRFVTVATTRPETMLGDTAVAINEKDARYMDLHGKRVLLPLMNREIPIVLDPVADPEFGTGVVKLTPAHDPNDFEAGKRHDLPRVKVIDEDGKMTAEAGAYAGLDRFKARKRVVADLDALGLLAKVEPYTVSVGCCQRCKTAIEPLISKQWFVSMKPLAEPAIQAVREGRITIVPENWNKIYFDWMVNIRDWCVSRQLWWGHRIPAWHCRDCGQVTVELTDPTVCAHCGSAAIQQDPDVLDTWFSSGLWPFSTMGWPEQTEDLATYYPTSLMIMGYEILFFWAARMIMLGLECMGEVPFRTVYIHGIVRNFDKQKMSKTKGNTVDPLDVVEKFGTDAVRMALITGAAPGADIVWSEDKCPSARAFANKIWNAARFIFLKMESSGVQPWLAGAGAPRIPESCGGTLEPALEDRWIFSRLNRCAEQVNRALDQFRFHEAAQTLWHFFWHEFCDWYLEFKKLRLEDNSGPTADWRNLLTVFDSALRLLHPVMPFLTEELWQRLGQGVQGRPASIALARYPQYQAAATDHAAERAMDLVQEIVTAARNLRADMKTDPKQQLDGVLYARGEAVEIVRGQLEAIRKLANVRLELEFGAAPKLEGAARSTTEFDLALRVPAAQVEAQRKRLEKEVQQLEKLIANSERQLGDETFLARAPEKVVQGIREKLGEYQAQFAKSRASLAGLD
ncbi:MAG: valine--tRNA ligase [Bryobacterales bacterium]|nr:valine--tRNA ligase [Bryobacterales bacterium]